MKEESSTRRCIRRQVRERRGAKKRRTLANARVQSNSSTHIGYTGDIGLRLQGLAGFRNFRVVEGLEGSDWVELERDIFSKVRKHDVEQCRGIAGDESKEKIGPILTEIYDPTTLSFIAH